MHQQFGGNGRGGPLNNNYSGTYSGNPQYVQPQPIYYDPRYPPQDQRGYPVAAPVGQYYPQGAVYQQPNTLQRPSPRPQDHVRSAPTSPRAVDRLDSRSDPRQQPQPAQLAPYHHPSAVSSGVQLSNNPVRFHQSPQSSRRNSGRKNSDRKNSDLVVSTTSSRRESPLLTALSSASPLAIPGVYQQNRAYSQDSNASVGNNSVSGRNGSDASSGVRSATDTRPVVKRGSGGVTKTTHIVSVTLSQGRDFLPNPPVTDPFVVLLVGSRDDVHGYLEKGTLSGGTVPDRRRKAVSKVSGKSNPNPSPLSGEQKGLNSGPRAGVVKAEWDERFDFLFEEQEEEQDGGRPDVLLLELWDKNYLAKDRLIGVSITTLKKYWSNNGALDHGGFEWIELVHQGRTTGQLHVQISCNTTDNEVQVQCASYSHLLRVQVMEAKALPSKDLLSKSDPYCEVQFSGTAFRTDVVKNNNNPVWHSATCYFWVNERSDADYKVGITVWDQDRVADDLLGQAFIGIRHLFNTIHSANGVDTASSDQWVDLSPAAETDVQLSRALRGVRLSGGKGVMGGGGSVRVVAELRTRGSVENQFFSQILDAVNSTNNNGRSSISASSTSTVTSTASSTGTSTSTSVVVSDPKREALSQAQMTWVLDAIGSRANDREMNALFDSMDINKDGFIDRHEFRTFLHSARGQATFDIPKLLVFLAKGKTVVDSMMGAVEWESSTGSKHILVKDLDTGVVVKENIPVYVSAAIKAMTSTSLGRKFTRNTDAFMRSISQRQGRKYDDPSSKSAIQPFVDLHHISLEEVEKPLDQYNTFNEFFSRRLKPGARPIDRPSDQGCAVSPADCRMMVFDTVKEATEYWIKGKQFSIPSLLGPAAETFASRFEGGSVVVARLAPQDYHCWHAPVSGVLGQLYLVSGGLYSVNPAVVNHPDLDVFTVNKRAIVPIYTQHFGIVMLIAVAAVMVGSMEIEGSEGDQIVKGQLHGSFKFGGSTVILLFEPGRIAFERRLLANSTPKSNLSPSPGPFSPGSPAPVVNSPTSPILVKESLIRQGQFLGHATHQAK